jgi:DTW domain-containing protein YfiP
MIVESRFCMNIAQATINEMMSWREGDRMQQAYTAPARPAKLSTMIENRPFLLILQHPQEKRQALSTAAEITATVANAKVSIGLSWPNLSRALGGEADPGRWGVLYLGSARPRVDREIIALDRRGEPIDGVPVLRRLNGIVLIDGTWSQAKALWWRNPWLLKLQRLVLNPARPARYGKIRREPRREALSTIEAAAIVLRHAEAGGEAADALLAGLDRLIASVR